MATATRQATGRRPYRFSIEQVEAMLRAGILTATDRTELLEGVLCAKATQTAPHIVATARLNKFLHRAVPDGYAIGAGATIALPWPGRPRRGSLPEPDAIIIVGDPDTYGRRIGPGDIAIVFEVADTSLREDRTRTKERYARSAIAASWLVNIPGRRVEVYTD